jgi:hypothetical protein
MKVETRSLSWCEVLKQVQVARRALAPAPAERVVATSRIAPQAVLSPYAASKIAEAFFFCCATVAVQRWAVRVALCRETIDENFLGCYP